MFLTSGCVLTTFLTTYSADDNRPKSHKNMTFLVQAWTFLCFQAGRFSAMRSSASDLTVWENKLKKNWNWIWQGAVCNYQSFFFFSIWVEGELNLEMKLCELLVLCHCIHLPRIFFFDLPVPSLDRGITLVPPWHLILWCHWHSDDWRPYCVLRCFGLLSKSTLLIVPGFQYVYFYRILRVG